MKMDSGDLLLLAIVCQLWDEHAISVGLACAWWTLLLLQALALRRRS